MSQPEPDVGWQVLSWAWSKRNEIRDKLRNLYSWFRGTGGAAKQGRGILIIGPGGSGKTTLGKLLAGEYDFLFDAPGEYEESLGIEKYALKDAPGIQIVVPPGQQHRREATWSTLHADIAAAKFRGIILLAAYGYHTLGQISYKDHRLYGGKKDEFVRAYLEDRRKDELAILRQLAPHVGVNREKLWLLTLVTKQDLWWPQRSEVVKHYQEGEYGAEVEGMLGRQDRQRFRHEIAFASLVISNFATGKAERLKPNAEGYDHRLQVESLRRLFEIVEALKNWEESK